MRTILLFIVLLMLAAVPLAAQPDADVEDAPDPGTVLVDATFVACSDTTESLLVLADGRAMYALGNRGAAFVVAPLLLADLRAAIDTTVSQTDTTGLDTCATLGLIVDGPRFLLINTRKPAGRSRDLHAQVERLRKIGERRMTGTIQKFSPKLEGEPDSMMATPAVAEPMEIRRRVRMSPVAREWRCNGTVYVAAYVTIKGQVMQAFVQRVRTRGKCASLLTASALRAVMLGTYTPAKNQKGRPMASWMLIEVPFTRARLP